MNATLPLTQTPPASKGFPGLRCPLCGSTDIQALYLDDLTTCRCTSCEEDYTLDDVRELVAAWSRVLNWIDSAPTAE